MKSLSILICSVILFFSCNYNTKSTTAPTANITVEDTTANYFPVTTFLKGEIYNIKARNITPVLKTKIGANTDSAWVKYDSLTTVLHEFLNPIIDTSNTKKTYQEKSFKDETLATFTFTYDLRNNAADTFAFKNWDVLIDQETNTVKRIYLVKKINENTSAQLTWQTGKWCKIVYIKAVDGKSTIEKEETLSWSF
jgi:hypothetical protein